jgi:type I restriction enzyme, S subunit
MTSARWERRTLGSCVKFLSGGTPSKARADFWEDDIPWVSSGEMAQRHIHDTPLHITAEAAEEGSRLIPTNTVLVVVRGMSLAKEFRVAITKREVAFNQDLKALACERDIDPEFIFYVLLAHREHIRDLSTVASHGTKKRETNVLTAFEIKVPKIDVQRRIVDLVSAYDNLIENNRRRMTLLEHAARHLYQEWFVRLRFPGHEHTRISDGVPEGWERRKLIELCDSVDYGYTASADPEQVGPKFLRITDIVPQFIDWSAVPYCPIEDDRLARFRLQEGDIVIARTGATVGYAKRLHRRHPETVFASYLVRLRPRPDVDNLMLGVFVESQAYKDYVKSRVGGAAQPNANAQVLAAAEILLPTPSIQRGFRDFVEPLIDQREVLQVQNQKLRVARDLLLPRLMSGEVAV